MKKVVALILAAMLLLTATAALAEGKVVLGQVDYAAHGTGCFAVITVALQDDVILAAKKAVADNPDAIYTDINQLAEKAMREATIVKLKLFGGEGSVFLNFYEANENGQFIWDARTSKSENYERLCVTLQQL